MTTEVMTYEQFVQSGKDRKRRERIADAIRVGPWDHVGSWERAGEVMAALPPAPKGD
jgi:hypothetical protein